RASPCPPTASWTARVRTTRRSSPSRSRWRASSPLRAPAARARPPRRQPRRRFGNGKGCPDRSCDGLVLRQAQDEAYFGPLRFSRKPHPEPVEGRGFRTLNGLQPMTDTPTRAGFAAVIGAPNAGKSTLVNRLVGAKVSIVTRKVQ